MSRENLTDAVIGGALLALGGDGVIQALMDGNAWAVLLHGVMVATGAALIVSARRAQQRDKQ